jgi:hypothetical protein
VLLCCGVALLGALLTAGPAAAAPPANDNFANATALSGSSLTTSGTNVQATKQAGEPKHAGDLGGASVWYVWTAPSTGTFSVDTCNSDFDTLLAVYTGSAVNALTEVASNDEAPGCASQSQLAFHASNSTTYRIAVDGWSASGEIPPDTGNIALHLHLAAPPANDNFANAITLTGTDTFVASSNASATKQIGEPNHAGNPGGSSVWYQWTAPATGTVSIDTCFATFDTLLAVYTGGSIGSLNLVASADDSCGPGSGVTFVATQGVTYHLAVDGSDTVPNPPAVGFFGLFLYLAQPPPNDNFANAQVLSGFSAHANGDNFDASSEPGEPAHAGIGPLVSVWYAWTAPASGQVTIDTCDSDFDTTLAVYTGNAVNSLNGVASNNNSPTCPPRSRVTFTAAAGTTYRIAVDGDFDIGNIDLDLALQGSAPVAPRDVKPPRSKITKVTVDSKHHKATIKFSSSEPRSSFRCKLDRKPFRPCRSPKIYRHLDPGKHKVKVQARDAAGNLDPTPAVRSFKIKS